MEAGLAQCVQCLNPLDCTTRDEEFFQGTTVEFVELEGFGLTCQPLVGGSHRINHLRAVTPHDRTHQLSQQVVGQGLRSCTDTALAIGESQAVAVSKGVAPLIAVGKAFVACPTGTQAGAPHPSMVSALQDFKVFVHDSVCLIDSEEMATIARAIRNVQPAKAVFVDDLVNGEFERLKQLPQSSVSVDSARCHISGLSQDVLTMRHTAHGAV